MATKAAQTTKNTRTTTEADTDRQAQTAATQTTTEATKAAAIRHDETADAEWSEERQARRGAAARAVAAAQTAAKDRADRLRQGHAEAMRQHIAANRLMSDEDRDALIVALADQWAESAHDLESSDVAYQHTAGVLGFDDMLDEELVQEAADQLGWDDMTEQERGDADMVGQPDIRMVLLRQHRS